MTSGNELPSVLVIDDERDVRDGCQRILSRRGYRVIVAEDGQTGLNVLAGEPVSLTLLDLKMPGLDGMEVLRRIRENHPDILVIVITGFATVETAIEAMKLGAYDFISKPFRPDQLRLVVDRAAERKRLVDETNRLREERQRTLTDLDTEKSRTRTIIRSLPHGVAVTIPDGRVVLMNPALNRLIGLDPEAGPGRHISEYFQDEKLCGMVLEVSTGKGQKPAEAKACETMFGEDRYFWAQCSPIPGEGGRCLGAVLVLTDISEWRLLDRLRTEFLAKVSHELRSPLSTIDLQLGLALDQAQPDQEKQERLLSRAKERTKGLIFLIRDLLDISRIELKADRQQPASIHLEELLGQVVDSLVPQAANRGQSLTLKLPDKPLPVLSADPVSLESVFTNLLANAINYTQDGGSINVTATFENGQARIEFQDNGFGIAPEHQEVVFEKFYRVKNEKTRYIVGTGLGLPIVKAVIEGLGGRITLDSEVDRGSTFTILLPVEADQVRRD